MPYTLSIITDDARDLVVAALRAAGEQRTRVGRQLARSVAQAKRDGKDVRSQAVKVTDLMSEADVLIELAVELATQDTVSVVTTTTPPAVEPATPADDDGDGTGLSPAAQAAARALDDTPLIDPDAPDLDTGGTAEDDTPPEGDL